MTADTNFHLRRIATALERIAAHLEAVKPDDKPPSECGVFCPPESAQKAFGEWLSEAMKNYEYVKIEPMGDTFPHGAGEVNKPVNPT